MLNNNGLQQGVVEGCQGTQVVRKGLVQAIVTGYPQPTVMWFRDVQRTSRITNDTIYQLLPNGDVSCYNSTCSRASYIVYKHHGCFIIILPASISTLALVVCRKYCNVTMCCGVDVIFNMQSMLDYGLFKQLGVS